MNNPLVKKYKDESRWVTWKYQDRKGKKTKVPFSIAGDMASSTDADTWSTYDEVKNFSDNIGIVFTPAQTLLGIDLDKFIVDGKLPEDIQKFVDACDTYTEISPSEIGLHLFLELSTPVTLSANRHGQYEVYTSGRYFTVTEKPFGKIKEIRTVKASEALELLKMIGYPWKEKKETEPVPNESQSSINVTRSSEKKPAEWDYSKRPGYKTVTHTLDTVGLMDDQVLERMFASEKGPKIRSLYDGALDIKDKSAADLSLCSYLAFWCRKDPTQMERLWVGSPLGSRKKTQQRKEYRDWTITKAIEGCQHIYENTSIKAQVADAEDELDLLFTVNSKKDKVFTQNTENMCRLLRKYPDFKDSLRYDIFKNTLEIFSQNKWRNIEDNDAVNIQTQIQILFPSFGKVGKEMIYDAVIKVAKENAIDSASDYIRSLKWDGVKRLDTWLCNACGVTDDLYHRAVGANWIKGFVKRIVHPGCKFDYVLVLEGPQGTRKSTLFAVLGGSWHVETTMGTDSKDFFMQMQGKAIIEFSEGETLNRTEVKKMKAIITTQSDKYRPPYERSSQDFPRRCVFAMTTNQDQYLKDETGNRRWLPVTLVLPEVNIEWVKENREQLFAEAFYRVDVLDETIYEFPKEETLAAQNARRIDDPNADLIVDWYFNKLSEHDQKIGINTHQVYRDALYGGFPNKPLDKFSEMNIVNVLKNVLKLEKRRAMVNKVQANRWFASNKTSEETAYEKIITIEEENIHERSINNFEKLDKDF